MRGLDLSKFKKVSSDDNCTVLEHSDGHSLKIAHQKLSSKMRSELHKLPAKKAVKKMAEGGDPVQENPEQIASSAADQAQPPATPPGVNININAQPQQPPLAGSPVGPMGPAQEPQMPQAPAASPPPMQASKPEAAPQGIAPAPQQSQGMPQSASPTDQTQPAQQPKIATAQPVQNQPLHAVEQYKQSISKELLNEDKAWENDLVNGHIEPQTYGSLFAKKDTLGKIGTIFGLMLSGAGSGLSHQPNALLNMMDNQIKNDLEAQKQSKANAQNYIQLGQRQQETDANVQKMLAEGRLTSAQAQQLANTNAYGMSMRAAYQQLVQNTNKLPVGSPERNNAENQLAMLYPMVGNAITNAHDQAAGMIAYSQFMSGALNQSNSNDEQHFQQKMSGLRMMGPQGGDRAKDLESKHMPGVPGQASVPLSSEDRDKIQSGNAFGDKLHRFMDWTSKHSGDLSPSDINEGRAMAADLQGAYREATHGGVYKESEKNFISQLIDENPTKFFNEIRVMPQLKALANENKARVEQFVKSKGFSGTAKESSESKPDHSAKSASSHESKPKQVIQNGHTYTLNHKTGKYE